MESKLTLKQKNVLRAIYDAIVDSGYPPTLADLREKIGVSSNQAVLNYLNTLEKKGCIKRTRDHARGIKILNRGFRLLKKDELVPVAGTSAAGPYVESFADTFQKWIPLSQMRGSEVVRQSEDDVFIVQVQGDSMTGIGIEDGNMLLVKKSTEYKSGDIVVARTDEGTTVKRFIADGGKRYLKPENPDYKDMPIIPGEVEFQGKIVLNLSKTQ